MKPTTPVFLTASAFALSGCWLTDLFGGNSTTVTTPPELAACQSPLVPTLIGEMNYNQFSSKYDVNTTMTMTQSNQGKVKLQTTPSAAAPAGKSPFGPAVDADVTAGTAAMTYDISTSYTHNSTNVTITGTITVNPANDPPCTGSGNWLAGNIQTPRGSGTWTLQ